MSNLTAIETELAQTLGDPARRTYTAAALDVAIAGALSDLRQAAGQPLALAGQHSAEQELADLVMLAELGLRYPFPAPLKTLWEDLINEGHGARAKDKWADERDEDWALFLPESWWRASSMSAHVPHRASGEIDTVSVAALAGRLFGGIQLGKVQPCRP